MIMLTNTVIIEINFDKIEEPVVYVTLPNYF